MKELLDDEFSGYEPYIDALSAQERKTLEGKIPYSILRGNILADICMLFDEHGIDYTLQTLQASTNGTGIIPLASTQLDMVDTLVYIEAANKEEANQLVTVYETQLAESNNKRQKNNSKQLYFWSVLFILLVIGCAYLQWKISNKPFTF